MKIKTIFEKFKNKIINDMFPEHLKCIFCSDELDNRSYNDTCSNCLETIKHPIYVCKKCGSPLDKPNTPLCLNCKTSNLEFNYARSVFTFQDSVQKVVHQLKYNGKTYLAKPMAKYIADLFATLDLFPDFVTFVPMFNKKEKLRGYNQSKLIAEEFSKLINIPLITTCDKIKDTESQTSLTYKQRRENVADVFKLNKNIKKTIKDKIIIIIDDVITTGATTSEISKVLIKSGARSCYVLTFAHSKIDSNLNN